MPITLSGALFVINPFVTRRCAASLSAMLANERVAPWSSCNQHGRRAPIHDKPAIIKAGNAGERKGHSASWSFLGNNPLVY